MITHKPLKLIFTLSLFLCSLFVCFAQTADRINVLLQTQSVTCADAAWFVLQAANIRGNYDRTSAEASFKFAAEKQWLKGKTNPGDKINLMQTSRLIMGAFEIKGGIWYSIFKNPHYAYREMVYQNIIQSRSDPRMEVSGELLLFMVERLQYRNEETPWTPQQEVSTGPRIFRTEEQLKDEMALIEEINAHFESEGASDVSARLTDEGITISLSNIQFLANSAELPESEKERIQDIARVLQVITPRTIQVSGHTAQAGTEAGRRQISRERAQSVADYLVELGVRKPDELIVQGYGSERPLADNSTPEGMALNRRVEFTIIEEQQ